MDSFFIALNSVLPFVVYIAFGMIVRMSGIADEDLMRRMNQMVFKAFYPVMMFYNLYTRDPDIKLDKTVLITALASVFVVIGLLMLLVPVFEKENPRRGSIIQAIYRSNFILFGVPLTKYVFGEKGVGLATMMVAFVVPVYNFMAVVILEYYGGGSTKPILILKKVLTNPIIVGCLAGLIFYVLHIPVPQCVLGPVSEFAALTTPIALFILGGSLRFSSIKNNLSTLYVATAVKLILLPALILPITVILNFSPLERFVLFTMYAGPCAAASFPMAQSMGCDGELAAGLVVFTTVGSVLTIFLWIFFMKSVGLI
jgi:hypothetical protein